MMVVKKSKTAHDNKREREKKKKKRKREERAEGRQAVEYTIQKKKNVRKKRINS